MKREAHRGRYRRLRRILAGGRVGRPDEAILHAAPLRIVSAAPLPPRMVALQLRPDRDHVADFIRSERDTALDAAASRAARVAPGLVIVTDPVAGPPAQGVAESGTGAAMLVVGSRGAGAFTALTLGRSAGTRRSSSLPGRGHPRLPPVASGLVGVGMSDLDDCADRSPSRSMRPACVRPRCLLSTPGPAPPRVRRPRRPVPGWPS